MISPLSARATPLAILFCLAGSQFVRAATTNDSPVEPKPGHSAHGNAFDSGPRQKPWVIQGIGRAPLPITTQNPEVQRWFDQGNAMLHSFFFYEAERAFRWCVKLEPENAMAYWGLARATQDRRTRQENRAADFLREAVKRKNQVTERERLYIESLEVLLLPDPTLPKSTEPEREQVKKLETLVLKYPDDIEAKSLLALATLGDSRYATELVIREVLSRQPDHPGAHHYRIHNWDYHEPEQALPSCQAYTDAVPGIGHAQHMPGHIYSIVGMWDEAALSMDAATRVEKRYMQESLTFPFNNWNYAHNRNYLSYIQEQLGLPEAAIFGARQLIDAPLDVDEKGEESVSTRSMGIAALARAFLKYERWDDLLAEKGVPWRDTPADKVSRAYFETRAWLAKGDFNKAEQSYLAFEKAKEDAGKKAGNEQVVEIGTLELKARLAIARGNTLLGLGWLADAAQKEYELQRRYADPPSCPESLYNSLGEAYLSAKSPVLAAQAFEKGLELTHNDLFSLSGLVRAYAALGETAKAEGAMARLVFVTAHAEPGLAILERAKAVGVQAMPQDASPAPQRRYTTIALDRYGPPRWQPYPAPQLEVKDSEGKTVTLEQYRDKNIILVFYLGAECPHCLKQLQDLRAKKDEWERLDTVVLAVSSKDPATEATKLNKLKDGAVVLLTDTDHVNARRFHSYDDFEDLELHSTSLVDKRGRVYWARYGGEPFTNLDFLSKQLEQMNDLVKHDALVAGQTKPVGPGGEGR
jgi:peroxiredoxin